MNSLRGDHHPVRNPRHPRGLALRGKELIRPVLTKNLKCVESREFVIARQNRLERVQFHRVSPLPLAGYQLFYIPQGWELTRSCDDLRLQSPLRRTERADIPRSAPLPVSKAEVIRLRLMGEASVRCCSQRTFF